MKVSHILYKTNHLEEAINKFKDLGYKVEYGSATNPHNALIYFSEGPYIEMLEKAPISNMTKNLLSCLGKQQVVARFNQWEKAEEGFFTICLETNRTNFHKEKEIFKKYKQAYFITKSKRKDPAGRLLKWKLLFPYDLNIPFMMNYFNIDPKPKHFVHPNGVQKIKSLSFGIPDDHTSLLKELCDDYILSFHSGNGINNLLFEKERTN